MSTGRKILLAVFLAGVLTIILTTWGSVGSAILTLALLIGLGYILISWFLDTHDADDFRMEE